MTVYLSSSSIVDFVKCPKKVLYRIKKPFKPLTLKEMVIGEVAHKAIELGWRSKDVAYSVIKDEVRKRDLSLSDATNLQFFIDIFFLNFRGRLDDRDLIEYSFKLNLYDDVFLVGKIDRISGGNIFDWKTTARPSKRSDNDIQCMIYDYAYRNIFKEPAKSINVVYLSKGTLVPYMRNSLYESEVFENIIPRMIKTIRNNSYERLGIFNHSCFRCPYKVGCLGGSQNELDSSEFVE